MSTMQPFDTAFGGQWGRFLNVGQNPVIPLSTAPDDIGRIGLLFDKRTPKCAAVGLAFAVSMM